MNGYLTTISITPSSFYFQVQTFDFTKAVPYSPEYLAGIPAERYTFGKLTFPVAINGQTGETYCEVPTHIKKLIILAIIAFIVASVLTVLYVVFCSKYIPYF